MVEDSAEEASVYNRKVAAQVNADAKKSIEDAGTTTVYALTPAERKAFKDAVVPTVWQKYADVIGKDLVDELVKTAQ